MLNQKTRDFLKQYRLVIALLIVVLIWLSASFGVYHAELGHEKANIRSFPIALWWGLVTLMTVGYGDFYPVTATGRFCAVCLMITGVAGIGIMTAKISAMFLEEVLLEGRHAVDRNKLKNHFIVCGWKEDMRDLLLHILDFNPKLTAEEMVIVANLSSAATEELLAHPRLKQLKVVIGDYFQEVTLRKAAPERAQKVLILADRTPGRNEQIPNPMETDARTIMTAITLSSIARGTLVAAEIIDPKLDNYLKMAGVSEIIYSREYSRLLLSNASSGTGIINVVHGLLDPQHPDNIRTPEIPGQFVDKTYREFRDSYQKANPRCLVIGVLEHAGNPHRIKELALRDAQKTPNVAKLIENLNSVKNIKWNHPVFNPDENYIINRGTAAIVLGDTSDQVA